MYYKNTLAIADAIADALQYAIADAIVDAIADAIAETTTAVARDIMRRNVIAITDAIAQLLINSVRAQLGSTCSDHPHLGSPCLDLHRTLASDSLMVTPGPHMNPISRLNDSAARRIIQNVVFFSGSRSGRVCLS